MGIYTTFAFRQKRNAKPFLSLFSFKCETFSFIITYLLTLNTPNGLMSSSLPWKVVTTKHVLVGCYILVLKANSENKVIIYRFTKIVYYTLEMQNVN